MARTVTIQGLLKDTQTITLMECAYPQPGDAVHNDRMDAEKAQHERAADVGQESFQALQQNSVDCCGVVDAVKLRARLSRHRSLQSIALSPGLHWIHSGGSAKDLHRPTPVFDKCLDARSRWHATPGVQSTNACSAECRIELIKRPHGWCRRARVMGNRILESAINHVNGTCGVKLPDSGEAPEDHRMAILAAGSK